MGWRYLHGRRRSVGDVVDEEHLYHVVAPLGHVLPHRAWAGASHGKAHAEQYAGQRGQYLAREGTSLRPLRRVPRVRAEVGRDLAHLILQGIQSLPGDFVQLLSGQPAMTPGRVPGARNHLVDVLPWISDFWCARSR